VSDKVIAMSEKIQNQEKEKNINSEKNVPIVQRLASALMGALRDTTDKVNEYKGILSVYVSNPFSYYAESDVVQFRLELDAPINLPKYFSLMVFGAELTVNAIEIKGHHIYFYFEGKSDIEGYKIELDNERVQLMDLALLIYILNNMSYNDYAKFSSYLQTYKENVEQEKNELLKILKDNGIEINN